MFSEINSAMLWEFGSWDDGMNVLVFFFAQHVNTLFDPTLGKIPRLVHLIHKTWVGKAAALGKEP